MPLEYVITGPGESQLWRIHDAVILVARAHRVTATFKCVGTGVETLVVFDIDREPGNGFRDDLAAELDLLRCSVSLRGDALDAGCLTEMYRDA